MIGNLEQKTSKKILVVDDEPGIRSLICDIAKDYDIACDQADTADKGLEVFEPGKYKLVYLDIRMPGMSSEEALYKILEQDNNVKVVFFSATLDDLKKNPESERVYLLEKPAPIQDIAKYMCDFNDS